MEDAPDIDVIITLNIENQVVETLYGPGPDTWQFQFEAIAWRSAGRMARNMTESLFDGTDKT